MTVFPGAVYGKLIRQQSAAIPLPLQISGVHRWFSAQYPSSMLKTDGSVAGSGEAVKTWVDQTASGNNAVQNTGSAQPLLNLTAINSKPGLAFTSAASKYLLSTISVTGTTCSVFLVMNLDAFSGNPTHSSIVYSANADENDVRSARIGYRNVAGGVIGYRNANMSAKTGIVESAPYRVIWGSIYDGVNNTMYWNSKTGEAPVATSSTFGAVEWYLACGRGAPGAPRLFSDCTISEAVIYTTALSTTDKNNLMDYFNARYAAY